MKTRLLGAIASGALVLVAVILGVTSGDDRSGSADVATSSHFIDAAELIDLERSLDHPVYWAGEEPPTRLELKQEVDGSVYLRYLPPAAQPGDPRVTFLTVGTYPVSDAQGAVRRAASQAGVAVGRVASGGIVLLNPSSEGSVYLAYPDSDLEGEVYDPTPGRALELIRSGAVRPVGQG